MGKKIRAIVKRADEEIGHVTYVSNTLENLQRTVGGYIECVSFYDKERDIEICVLCDEEGLLKGKQVNCIVYFGDVGCGFVGDILVVGIDGEDFGDLPAEITMKEWKEMISYDELY